MDWSDRSEYDSLRYREKREQLVKILGGNCNKCNSVDGLEFDHIDPTSKKFSITKNIFRDWEELETELAKCQLLCETCHSAKTIAAISVEHGGGLSGKRNCKCEPCKLRKREYMLDYKARTK